MMEIAFLLLMVVAAGHIAAGGKGCSCTFELKEVCGSDGVTYSNPCLANCSGVFVVHEGPCKSTTIAPPAEYPSHSCICTEIYDPVCGANGKTYGNACEAKCRGVSIVHKGPCESTSVAPPAEYLPPPCKCPRIYDPVCGSDGKIYDNECLANCSGVSVVHKGPCKSTTIAPPAGYSPHSCICPLIYDPVCGSDGKTYGNACEAKCRGVSVVHEGPCKSTTIAPDPEYRPRNCICPLIYAPVCGSDGNTYWNKCRAICRRVTDYVIGACSDVCNCNKKYEPVCHVITGTKYVNLCYAKCLGADPKQLKPCYYK